MLDHAIGPNVISALITDLGRFLESNASRGWRAVSDFVGLRRNRIVAQSRIRRPTERTIEAGTSYASEESRVD